MEEVGGSMSDEDEHKIGDAPVEARFENMLNALGMIIDEFINDSAERKNGFVLMIFPFHVQGRANYISNAHRDDVLIMLKEQVKLFEEHKQKREH
jgi:hypothetical protein